MTFYLLSSIEEMALAGRGKETLRGWHMGRAIQYARKALEEMEAEFATLQDVDAAAPNYCPGLSATKELQS